MKIELDTSTGSVYIRLRDYDEPVHYRLEAGPSIKLDYCKSNMVIGIQVLKQDELPVVIEMIRDGWRV